MDHPRRRLGPKHALGPPQRSKTLASIRGRVAERPDYRRLVLVTTLFGTAAGSYPFTVLSAALPSIARDLGTTDDTITWVIAAPALAFAVLMPIVGKIGDLYGHRGTCLVSFTLGSLFALATSLAWDITSLIVLRTLGQATLAAAGPSSMAIILSTFSQRERTRVLGIWAAVVSLSPAIGVVTGGPLIEWLGWRVLFIIQAGTVALALFGAVFVSPETPRRGGVRFDAIGSITLGIGVTCLLLAVNRGFVWGWGHPVVLASTIISPIGLILFLQVENRVTAPLLPPALMRRKAFSRPMTAQAVLQSGYVGALVMAPFLLERRWGFRPTMIGLLMLPRTLSFAFFARLGGLHDSRHGARRVAVTGMVIYSVAMVLVGVGAQQRWLVMFLAGAMMAGMGSGYIRPTVANAVTAAAGDEDLGIAGGAMNMLQQIGGAVGITVLTALMADSLSGDRFLFLHLAAAGTGLIAAWLARGIEDTNSGPAGNPS